MNISAPWNLIGKILTWIWNKVTSFWLLKTYQKSHEYKVKNIRLGARWKKLGENIEYSLRLANHADHESLKSKVAFRTTKGMLKAMTLFFEATGNGIRYQQKIELANLDEKAIIVSLEQIPRQVLIEASDAGIFFTINEICFIECVVTLADGYQCQPFNSRKLHISNNWLLNDKWERRWGVLWNCNAIERAKCKIAAYWKWKLGEYRYFLLSQSYHKQFSIQSQIRKLICTMLIHPYMLTLQFWLAIHSGCFMLEDGELIHKNPQNK